MVSPLRRIGKSANQRIGNSRVLETHLSSAFATRADASQPARRFSRINEPRANYPPPWKLSWKYWKVRGVECLLLVSGTTILLCDGCWAQRRFLTASTNEKERKEIRVRNDGIRVTGKNENWERENGTNDRVS